MNYPAYPPRRTGNHHDTVSVHCTEGDAGRAYARLRSQLLDIHGWEAMNDALHTSFALCDGAGIEIYREPVPGDFIRIDLRGPGSPSGEGYDWVVVTEVSEQQSEPEWTALTVRPCRPPGTGSGPIAHFFTEEATNTFVVRRLGNCLYAEVHGRNERTNLPEDSLRDRLRNRAVALAGRVGFGKVQWQDWTDGMVSIIQSEADG